MSPPAARSMRTLLCVSSRRYGTVQLTIDPSGEVALEAAADLLVGAAFGAASFDVGAGGGVAAHAGDDGHVQGSVQPPVTATVETVSGGVSGRGGDGVDTGERRERGLGAEPTDV